MGGGVWGGVEKGEPNHKRVVIIQHTGRQENTQRVSHQRSQSQNQDFSMGNLLTICFPY